MSKHFRFQLENRLRDDQSGQVRYATEDAHALSLQLPDEMISNREAYNAYKEAVAAAKAAKVCVLQGGHAVHTRRSVQALNFRFNACAACL